jgi:hypothetical protein
MASFNSCSSRNASIVGTEKPRRDLGCGQFSLSLSRLHQCEFNRSPKEPEILLR